MAPNRRSGILAMIALISLNRTEGWTFWVNQTGRRKGGSGLLVGAIGVEQPLRRDLTCISAPPKMPLFVSPVEAPCQPSA
jgi:hypothetical protein